MLEDEIIFKGYKDRLTIILNTKKSFDEIKSDFFNKLNKSQKFFKGIKKTYIEFKGYDLSDNQKLDLLDIFSCQTNSETFLIDKNIDLDKINKIQEKKGSESSNDKNIGIIKDNDLKSDIDHKHFYFKFKSMIDISHESKSVLYKNSLRSGQFVHYDGTVIILGDVNPGAEIVCSENIIVLGKIKGLVHAGRNGNKESIIAALGIYKTQIRIADIMSCIPDDNIVNVPSYAYVNDSKLYISPLIN